MQSRRDAPNQLLLSVLPRATTSAPTTLADISSKSGKYFFLCEWVAHYDPLIRNAFIKFSRYVTLGFETELANEDGNEKAKELIDEFNANVGHSIGRKAGMDATMRKITRNWLTFGLCIGELVYDKSHKKPMDLLIRSTRTFTIKSSTDKSGRIASIRQHGNSKKLDVEDFLIMTLDEDYDGEIYATSTVRSLLNVIDLAVGMETDLQKIVENYWAPNFAVIIPEGVPDTTITEINNLLQDTPAGTNFSIAHGADIKLIGAGQVQFNIEPYFRYIQDRIIGGLGFPKFMMGWGDDPNRATAKEQLRDFFININSFRRAIRRYIENEIYAKLLEANGFDPVKDRVKIVFDEFSVEDEQTKAETEFKKSQAALNYVKAGIMTQAEVRESLDLPELKPGELPPILLHELNLQKVTDKRIINTTRFETRFALDIQRYFIGMEDFVLDWLEEHRDKLNLSNILELQRDASVVLELDYGAEALQTTLDGYMTDAYVMGGQRAFKDLHVSGTFTLADPEAAEWLKNYTIVLADKESNEFVGKVRQQIMSGLNAGEGMDEIAARVRTTFEMTEERSKLIARTETMRATNEGRLAGYRQSKLEKVEFLASGSACPDCAAMNGEIMTINEAQGEIPVHPNCECTWIPVGMEA